MGFVLIGSTSDGGLYGVEVRTPDELFQLALHWHGYEERRKMRWASQWRKMCHRRRMEIQQRYGTPTVLLTKMPEWIFHPDGIAGVEIDNYPWEVTLDNNMEEG